MYYIILFFINFCLFYDNKMINRIVDYFEISEYKIVPWYEVDIFLAGDNDWDDDSNDEIEDVIEVIIMSDEDD